MPNPTTDYLEGFELNAARGGWSEDAFHCARCPKEGCPLWWKLSWERTGEDGVVRERLTEGCGAAMAPALLINLLVGQQIGLQAFEERTNEIASKQDKQTQAVGAVIKGLLLKSAAASGNPVAIAAVPLLPRIIKPVRKLLSRKGRS